MKPWKTRYVPGCISYRTVPAFVLPTKAGICCVKVAKGEQLFLTPMSVHADLNEVNCAYPPWQEPAPEEERMLAKLAVMLLSGKLEGRTGPCMKRKISEKVALPE